MHRLRPGRGRPVTTPEQIGRQAVDDLCAILTVLDEAASTPRVYTKARVMREIRDIVGDQYAGLWRRVLDLSYSDDPKEDQ